MSTSCYVIAFTLQDSAIADLNNAERVRADKAIGLQREDPLGLMMAESTRAQRLDGVREAFHGFGEALFEEARSFGSDSAEVGRNRRRRQHEDERNYREKNSGNGGRDEHVICVSDVEPQDIEGNVFERLDVAKGRQSKEREEHRQRGEDDERDVEATMEFQAGAAAGAIGEVLLIVLTHLGRYSRDVIPPACKNCAYYTVGTIGFRHTDVLTL